LSGAVVLYGWLDKYLNRKESISLKPETDKATNMAKKTKQKLVENLKAARATSKRGDGDDFKPLALEPMLVEHIKRNCKDPPVGET